MGYDPSTCIRTSRQIATSQGAWAQRPGALCLSLGDCRESCKDPSTDADLSRCTATGWDDGVADEEIVDPCLSCAAGEICQRTVSEDSTICRCDRSTGFDTCTNVGKCVDRCVKFADRVAQYNSYITICTDDSDCPSNFDCDDTATARSMSCADGIISIAETNGACVPQSRTMTTAQFGDYGRSITVMRISPIDAYCERLCAG